MNLLQKLSVAAACGASIIIGIFAYVYAQPGKTMDLKWRRSYRRMRKFSKELVGSSNANLLPMVQGVLGMVQFLMDRLPQ